MSKSESRWVCQNCGYVVIGYMGRCPGCDKYNKFIEEAAPRTSTPQTSSRPALTASDGSRLYTDINTVDRPRISVGINELDRVLGGGLVPGSLVLLGGEPGIGKSTLLLQATEFVAEQVGPVLYVSGEESEYQVKSRGERLGLGEIPLYLLAETHLEKILVEIKRVKPALVVIDSIQTVFSDQMQSAPGSISQVRETARLLLIEAKKENIPIFLVGHVTKEGALAGPKALEHIVDTVLYFEGERYQSHRIVRAVKNRFGAVSELGVFEMTERGLAPVENPSKLFLSERSIEAPGSAVLCCMEGTRPILVEVQALVSPAAYGTARRTASGLDQQRLALLLAVLEKRASLNVMSNDVFVNVAGGMVVTEPASDLGVIAAVASSVCNRPIRPDTATFGEVGLAVVVEGFGEVFRGAAHIAEVHEVDFTLLTEVADGSGQIVGHQGEVALAEGDAIGFAGY